MFKTLIKLLNIHSNDLNIHIQAAEKPQSQKKEKICNVLFLGIFERFGSSYGKKGIKTEKILTFTFKRYCMPYGEKKTKRLDKFLAEAIV